MAKPKLKPKTKEKLVHPSTFEAGKAHVLEDVFDQAPEGMPTLKSVGFAPLEGGQWVSYTITSKGSSVLKIDIEEPGERSIAEDSAKIAFVNELMGQGL